MINWSVDVSTVTHSIQLAVAPVFFLTAVAGMIGAVAGRLARIIDRARVVEERIHRSDDEEYIARGLVELHFLRKRGRISNVCIGLLTLCGFCIGLTIALLFVGEAWEINGHVFAVGVFLLGLLSFVSALGCFLWETVLATRLLDFPVLERAKLIARTLRAEQAAGQQPSAPPPPQP